MEKNNFKISKYDTEVAAKWKDLLETAKEKGVLEIRESRTRRELIQAILIDFCSFFTLVVVNIAMFKCFGVWGVIGINLFIYTYEISYDTKNYFHKLIENWRGTK